MNSRKDLGTKLAELQPQISAHHAVQLDEALAGGPRKYWQCLEELADTEAFHRLMRQEFPALADVWPDKLSRRRFLSLMGASL
ncbi:MAG TPA: TAT-variant-translocated molybdopterin oxidoreductase, partial [Lacipirellulaceae bacterium]|nr:TAT-variant-translocated molybdopterin oxidoreductase [Lacipirellulaceae bacterium]